MAPGADHSEAGDRAGRQSLVRACRAGSRGGGGRCERAGVTVRVANSWSSTATAGSWTRATLGEEVGSCEREVR